MLHFYFCCLAACQPVPLYTFQVLHFFTYSPVVPSWLLSLSDFQFLQYASTLRLCLWSMEGKWKPCLKLTKSLLWCFILDCLSYGAVLAPVSVLFRLLGISLLLFGWFPNARLYRPSVRDVRFWFDTNIDLDLSYLWCPFKRRRHRKESRTPRSYHLRLRVQSRVVWVPVRDPLLCVCRPSTWRLLLWARRVPTDTLKRAKKFVSARSLANSLLGKVDLFDEPFPDLDQRKIAVLGLMRRCSSDLSFAYVMCKEFSVPDVKALEFFCLNGIPSTQHLLHAIENEVHPGHIERLLKKVDPLAFHLTRRFIENAEFFQTSKGQRELRMFFESADVAREVCLQLGLPYSSCGKAAAYHQRNNRKRKQVNTPIVFDTGCSVSISPHLEDFIGPLEKLENATIRGVGNVKHRIEGVGMVEWTVYDMNGEVFTIRTRAFYVPSSDIRLFSPQTFIQEQPESDDVTHAEVWGDVITLVLKSYGGKAFEFPFHPDNNIPYMLPTASK